MCYPTSFVKILSNEITVEHVLITEIRRKKDGCFKDRSIIGREVMWNNLLRELERQQVDKDHLVFIYISKILIIYSTLRQFLT